MQGLVREVAALALLISCSRAPDPPPPHDATPPESAVVQLARASIAEARKHSGGCNDRSGYLALRRELAALIPFVRYTYSPLADLIVGPRVIMGEVAGQLGRLDLAHNCEEQRGPLFQIDQALLLLDVELKRHGPDTRAVVHGLSDAAYQLGAEALESTPGTPSEEDAVEADLEGLTRAIAHLAPSASAGLKNKSRLQLAQLSGDLGEEIRKHSDIKPMYETLQNAKVSALALPKPLVATSKEKVALGDALFHDKRLSRGNKRACTGCHDPSKAWSDGRATPTSLEKLLRRNTPSLLYAPLAAVLHWDGRIRTADAQALNVIHARAEMGLTNDELLAAIRGDASLSKMFADAFADGVTASNVGHALAAYESDKLVPASSPFDRLARGDASAWTAEMDSGLEVFIKKGRCARCHVAPTFGGSRPPDFTAPVYGVIGVPSKPGGKVLDDDLGRFAYTQKRADMRAFRTPTVRNVALTAPYFHHGAFPGLEEVIDFYDKGGGRALGLDVPNQDPDVRPLALTAEERRVLLIFLREGLRDGS